MLLEMRLQVIDGGRIQGQGPFKNFGWKGICTKVREQKCKLTPLCTCQVAKSGARFVTASTKVSSSRKLSLFEEAFLTDILKFCSGWWIQECLHHTSAQPACPKRDDKLHKVTE